ncbi:MAG: homoserine O-succinyltransferase [Aquisalinus sp.]|nr:homoserine O-succinyltransferase [Aquisalinus sp.]
MACAAAIFEQRDPDEGSVFAYQSPLRLQSMCGPVEHVFDIPETWRGKYGGALPGEEVRVRFQGNLAGPKVVVLGGISASRFVASGEGEPEGWWSNVVRTGGGIDLGRFCVIGVDYPPASLAGETSLCPEDFAKLIDTALLSAGIEELYAFIGASFGGMIGLSYARLFAHKVELLAVLCAAHETNPMAQAWRLVQRRIISLARSAGRQEEGVALARQLAMTTYRAPEEFAGRFDLDLESQANVGAYLEARGEQYSAEVTPARYLTLSEAIDRHQEQPENITVPALFIGALSDRLVPLADIAELQRRYAGLSELVAISSVYGHDAFLKESQAINPYLHNFLKEISA